LEQVIHALEDLLQTMDGTLDHGNIHTLQEFWVQASYYHHKILSLNVCSVISPPINTTQYAATTDKVGRPQVTINIEQVECFRTAGFTWQEISRLLGIGCTTLWRRLTELGVYFKKIFNYY